MSIQGQAVKCSQHIIGRETGGGVVVYDGSRFMLWKSAESEYFGNDGGYDLDWVLAQDDEFAVNGNRWDNPELLEEAQHEKE